MNILLSCLLTLSTSPYVDRGDLSAWQNKIAVTTSLETFFDAWTSLAHPSHEESVWLFKEHIVRPQGSRYWLIPPGLPNGTLPTFPVLARPSGPRYKFESLCSYGDEDFMPSDAASIGNDLLVTGLSPWMSNAPSGVAILLRKTSTGWHRLKTQSTTFEATRLKLFPSRGKWTFDVLGRTYPKNMNVSHALANIEMEQIFTYVKGALAASRPRRTMNPQTVLDDLIGYGLKGDLPSIEKHCVSKEIAKRMLDLSRGASASHWKSSSAEVRSIWTAATIGREFRFRKRRGKWVLTSIAYVAPS